MPDEIFKLKFMSKASVNLGGHSLHGLTTLQSTVSLDLEMFTVWQSVPRQVVSHLGLH